ncbi:MAG TPA: PEP-CTERM sorting domain-containing protein [Gallionella sp.]|nr:PEP-CTERM sorting domain-containing protein [Gallionella sp.]
MKLQSKWKAAVLGGVLALSIAGQASAAIVDMGVGLNTTNTGSNLVLSVWDPATQVSYTRDLGVSMSTFTNGVTVAGTAWSAAGGPANLSFAADATLTSFLAGIANKAGMLWNVTAGRNYAPVAGTLSATPALNNVQYLTTSTAPMVASPTTNNILKQFTGANQYYAAASGSMAPAATSVTTNAAAGMAYAGNAVFGTGFGQATALNNAAALGTAMSFYFLTPSSASVIAKAAFAAFNNTWNLDAAGNLTYGTVAAVPEPSEWAMMLMGLALIGFIAMRRKDVNSPMNFA